MKRKNWRGGLIGALAAITVVVCTPAAQRAGAVTAIKSPTNLVLGASSFTSSVATWQWKTVPGGVTYVLTVTAVGGGKVKKWETHQFAPPTISIAKSALPPGATGGFRATVQARALNGKLSAPSAVPQIKASTAKRYLKSKTVIKSKKDENGAKKAARAAASSVSEGGSLAVGTFAVSAPFVAFSTPIPGVGELTWTGLTAAVAVVGGATTVGCFVRKSLPFDRSILLGGGALSS